MDLHFFYGGDPVLRGYLFYLLTVMDDAGYLIVDLLRRAPFKIARPVLIGSPCLLFS